MTAPLLQQQDTVTVARSQVQVMQDHQHRSAAVGEAVTAFADAILDLGRAAPGDKTLVDALLPFRDGLVQQLAAGRPVAEAWRAAASTRLSSAAWTSPSRACAACWRTIRASRA